MFRKFRRSSKDPTHPNGRSLLFATPVRQEMPDVESKPAPFFRLPAEIRNEIYVAVARMTTLTLMPRSSRQKPPADRTASAPGLLLASRQCRREALPILLSAAAVHAKVLDFDFRNLARVIQGLYSTELKALRANRNLVIRLRFNSFMAYKRSIHTDLRRWLDQRGDGLDRLPWRYEVDASLDTASGLMRSHNMGRIMWLWELYDSSQHTVQWELLGIIRAVESYNNSVVRTDGLKS